MNGALPPRRAPADANLDETKKATLKGVANRLGSVGHAIMRMIKINALVEKDDSDLSGNIRPYGDQLCSDLSPSSKNVRLALEAEQKDQAARVRKDFHDLVVMLSGEIEDLPKLEDLE